MGIGAGIDTSGRAAREQQGIVELFTRLRGFIPANPVASAAEMQMIPLVVFSLFVGIAGVIEMGKNPERVEPFRKILESFLTVIMRVTKMVISLTPYGVAGLMAYRMSNTGLSAISDLGLFVAGVVIACLIQIGVVYSGLLLTLPRVSPLRFFKAASPAMLLAFTSRSSIIGTLTLTTAGLPVEAIGLVVVGDRLGEFDREAFNSPFPSPSLS
jgi:Na+/H+-dicarboxylate symporter